MASSGSGSRKGFPEAGGKYCKPQGQEDVLFLKGHRVCSLPSESQESSSKLGKATGTLRTQPITSVGPHHSGDQETKYPRGSEGSASTT